jgi:hypothetical protein
MEPQIRAWNASESSRSLTHHSLKSLKQSVPLKSWPVLVPVDQNHICHRGRGCVTMDTLQGLAVPLQRINPRWLLHWLPWGFQSGLDIWHRSPFHSTSSRAGSMAPQPPSLIWKETLEWHWGSDLPASRDPGRLHSQGVGTHCATGLIGVISLWPPEMLLEECQATENKTQTQVVRRKGRFIMLAGQHLDLSKNGMAP